MAYVLAHVAVVAYQPEESRLRYGLVGARAQGSHIVLLYAGSQLLPVLLGSINQPEKVAGLMGFLTELSIAVPVGWDLEHVTQHLGLGPKRMGHDSAD